AAQLKRSPVEISSELAGTIKNPSLIKEVKNVGPYLNFFIDYQKYAEHVLVNINDDYGQLETKNDKIILEHTSANPNGPLHIGHIRNAILGDSLNRILKKAGYVTETQYYVNDMGRQIAMVVWGLFNLKFDPVKLAQESLQNQEMDPYQQIELLISENPEFNGLEDKYLNGLKNILYLQIFIDANLRDHQIGELYFEVNQKLKKDPGIKGGIDELLRIYENGEDPLLGFFFKEAVNACLEGMEPTLNRLNVHHDSFVWESKFVRNGSVNDIIKKLKDDGHTQENEVLYLNLENYGIEKELVLMRSDGTSLYSTRDLAYHLEKFKESDVVIDILGSDHKLAIKQISIILELLGGNSPEVIFYEFITLPEGSMSTRRGVFISVDDLMEEAVERAVREVKNRRDDLDEVESRDIAEKIGIGAIRYYIARLSPEKHIVFKWDEALSFERGCASIQYAHARACKILKKVGEFNTSTTDLESILNHYELQTPEIELVKTISQFSWVIEESARNRKVHHLAQYCLDLASAFNKFYKSVPVIGSEEEILRLVLVDKARITLRNSLDLLGIDAPETM
ncbi:MAG TPA: arginine--tRNA ligase, partial [Methanobacterium sp.]|nr:arginine--tRNA ligase [Methanobacterium sp.]